MSLQTTILAGAICLLFQAAQAAQAAQCPALDDSNRDRLVRYVAAKYKLPQKSFLSVAEGAFIGASCYRKIEFASKDPKRPFRLELVASPDLRYLSRDLMDSTTDPVREEQRKEQALAAKLSDTAAPTLGPKDAPVTVVVFSDFQCPYCAMAANGLMKDLRATQAENVRFMFHHFPLPMHPWAKAAAEAAACAQQQGSPYFWQLYDFIFEHQKEIAAESLERKLMSRAAAFDDFDVKKFELCLDEKKSAAIVEKDMALGNEAGVHATPTLFINGRQVTGGRPEEVLTLIRQAIQMKSASASLKE